MTEIEQPIAYADVRESIAVARSHGEKFFEQIVWQVENEAWTVLGYKSWDEMREAEYADLGVVAPRADRPELVTRLRAKGLTQQQIGSTIGVSEASVSRQLANASSDETAPATITNARGQERPASYAHRPATPTEPSFDPTPSWDPVNTDTGEITPEPRPVTGMDGKTYTRPEPKETPKPKRRPIHDSAREAGMNLRDAADRMARLFEDDRFNPETNELAPQMRNQLAYAIETCQGLIDRIPPKE